MSRYDLIKVDNDIQTLDMSKLNKNEMKVFIKLLQIVANKMDQTLRISFNEFRDTIEGNYTEKEIGKLINETARKIFASYITIRTINKTTLFTFFTTFEIYWKEKYINAQVNQMFLYFINNLIKQFTIFNLSDILNFKSKYSILTYKKIKEYNGQKTYIFSIDEFIKYFDIKSKTPIKFFDMKMKPLILKEIKEIFPNFEIIKEKYKGKSIKEIIFKW